LFQSKSIGQRTWGSATPANEDTAEFYIIPVSKYDISDERFVEIEFYPRVLKDKWARVFIPKDQVVAIVVLESSEDLGKIGYKV
jgi:hypothetical protein